MARMMRFGLPQTWQETFKFTRRLTESIYPMKRTSVDCEGEGS